MTTRNLKLYTIPPRKYERVSGVLIYVPDALVKYPEKKGAGKSECVPIAFFRDGYPLRNVDSSGVVRSMNRYLYNLSQEKRLYDLSKKPLSSYPRLAVTTEIIPISYNTYDMVHHHTYHKIHSKYNLLQNKYPESYDRISFEEKSKAWGDVAKQILRDNGRYSEMTGKYIYQYGGW